MHMFGCKFAGFNAFTTNIHIFPEEAICLLNNWLFLYLQQISSFHNNPEKMMIDNLCTYL